MRTVTTHCPQKRKVVLEQCHGEAHVVISNYLPRGCLLQLSITIDLCVVEGEGRQVLGVMTHASEGGVNGDEVVLKLFDNNDLIEVVLKLSDDDDLMVG